MKTLLFISLISLSIGFICPFIGWFCESINKNKYIFSYVFFSVLIGSFGAVGLIVYFINKMF